MKFQKLIIHNIASIENAEIDFSATPLSDSGLFIIAGKTGSGKTTILDCICLALYGLIPRFKNTNIKGSVQDNNTGLQVDDPRQLLRRNTAECYIILTFIGNNSTHYQAEWSVRRSRNKVEGNLQSREWRLQDLSNNKEFEKKDDIQEEIRNAIGLDFEQFLRTVMLSQGEFTKFLNSGDNEKAEILEKLTGIDIYSKIGQKIFEKTKDKKQNKDTLKQALDLLPEINVEQKAEQQKRLEELTIDYEKQRQILEQEKIKKQWIESYLQIEKDYSEIKEQYQNNYEIISSEGFKKKENSIQIWRKTYDIRSKITRQSDLKNSVSNYENTLLQYNERFQALVGGYIYIKNEKTSKQIQLSELAQLLSQQKNQQELTEFLQNLGSLKQALDNKKSFQERILRIQERILQIQERISRNQERISKELNPSVNALKSEYEKAKSLYEKQKDSVDKFAKNLRQTLSVGDICPVCLQKIENSLPIEEELYEIVNTLKQNYETSKQNYENIQQEINRLTTDIETNKKIHQQEKSYLENDTSLKDCEKRIEELSEKCGLNDKTIAEKDIEIAEKEAKKTLEKIDEYNKVQQDFNILEKECENMKTIFLNIFSQMPEWKNQINKEAVKVNNLHSQLNVFNNDLTRLLAQFNSCKKDIVNLENEVQVFLQSNQEYTREKLDTINSVPELQILEIEKEVINLKNQHISLASTKESIEKRREEHLNNKPEIENIEAKEEIELKIVDLENQLREISEQKGGLEKEIAIFEQNIKQKEKLNKEYNQANEVFLKWNRLNDLFGDANGTKFRKIAQSYVLSNLVNSANYYIKTLTDRYKLKVEPGTFVIEVEDAYQGFVKRSVTTISGGESFIVSLSLALALSDMSQLSLDILFIDEGFGTLSKDVLQTAIESLSRLHSKVGKRVGIISHVEELQEKIPVQIQVKKDGNNSSSTVSVVDNANRF